LDLLFNAPTVQRVHWVPAKRIGYLMWRIRYHYKDDTLDLRWASAKVRHLIDKYLVHIDITERVSEISILSDDFPLKIDELYKGSKSKASAMEHAIRQQIKVKLENSDPALYRHFKDRLENIMNTYQGNWDMMIVELEELRKEATLGRKENYLLPKIQAPFMDLMTEVLEEERTVELNKKIVELTGHIYQYIWEGLLIANFWEKNDEKKRVTGQIEQRIRLCGIQSLKINNKDLAVQMMMLAKNNYSEILNSKFDES
jgi:type I restriction enzyme R subunit